MSEDLVKHILQQNSVDHYGFAPLQRPLSIDLYKEWISKGLHADMAYLAEHTEKKESPQLLLKKAKSAIVITHPYPEPDENFPLKNLKIAKYACGGDYHHWLKEKMEALCGEFARAFPNEEFMPFTDSSPVLERDLAYQAGLGWVGKNSCLISRKKGSYFLIAEIYTTLELGKQQPASPDHCGTCRRCIDACPTEAINENRTLDSNKCISYWTIEAKTTPPLPLAAQFQSWFFGCDICQDVCPWNGKVYGNLPQATTHASHKPALLSTTIDDLRWILTSSNNELEKTLRHTPMVRARGRGLKRNALIVIANSSYLELLPEVRAYVDHPQLGELARWAVNELCTRTPNHMD